jgi:AAHS family 4-hydroxybenzoate transporter-like MFS transporter
MGSGINQPSVEIQDFIDKQPMGRLQLAIIALCGSVLFMDGFDAQSVGFVAPVLGQQLHITRGAMGPVFASGTLGIMIGALVFGPLADLFGRKPSLVWCTITFGLLSLLTATARSSEALLVYRILTGLGLGGAMPNAVALTSEFMPKRFRATAVTTTFVGFSIGAAVGGFVAAGLVRLHGWQSIFIVGGIVPCVIAVFLIALLPESIRFLMIQGGNEEKAARILSRIAPGISVEGARKLIVNDRAVGKSVVKQLFVGGRARMTLLIWVIFLMSLLDLYFLNAWLPTIIHDAGAVLETAIVLTALFQVGGAIGSVLLGRVLDRRRSFRVLAGVYLAAGFFVILVGVAGNSVPLLACTIFAAGFALIGGQSSANALTAEFYPTPIRSTGVGWALGVGRVGSILGPLLGGVLLTAVSDTRRVFWAAAVPALLGSAAGLLAGRTKHR